MTLAALLLAGCTGDDEKPDGVDYMAEGTIAVDDGSAGDVGILEAFAFATGGNGLLYASSNQAATCDEVVAYLSTADIFDPSEVLTPGGCNLNLVFRYDAEAGWDGETYDSSDLMAGVWSISCAMDDGTWELQDLDGDEDYFYTGRWWQGAPLDGQGTMTGSDTSIGFDLSMSEYDGDFIYEQLGAVPAYGSVSGSIEAEWCTGLAQTPLFGG